MRVKTMVGGEGRLQGYAFAAALLWAVLLLILAPGSKGEPGAQPGVENDPQGAPYVAGELLVAYEPGTSEEAEETLLRRSGARTMEDLPGEVRLVSFPAIRRAASEAARERALARELVYLGHKARVEAVDVRVASSGPGAAERVAQAGAVVDEQLGNYVWATGETTWAEAVSAGLGERGWTLAIVEHGLGGSLTALLGGLDGVLHTKLGINALQKNQNSFKERRDMRRWTWRASRTTHAPQPGQTLVLRFARCHAAKTPRCRSAFGRRMETVQSAASRSSAVRSGAAGRP